MDCAACLLLLLYFMHGAQCFCLPGLAPRTFCDDSKIEDCKSPLLIYVNRLNSVKNILPYEYHNFDFCVPPEDVTKSPGENLAQVIFGDRMRPSAYKLYFNRPVKCQTVCTNSYRPGDKESTDKLTFLKKGISFNYQHHWFVDSMPVTWCLGEYCSTSFPMGCYVTLFGQRKDSCVIVICKITGARKTDPAEYAVWWESHKDKCSINFSGSSGGMEAAAAKVLWGRSLNYKIRYTTLIGDGDSKTFTAVTKLDPYNGVPVAKAECVNHVAKRLGTALRNLVADQKKRGVTLGGRGKGTLTQPAFNVVDTYYLYNHVDIVIEYHPLSQDNLNQTQDGIRGRIVSAKVFPRSINHEKAGRDACDPRAPPLGIPGARLEKKLNIRYTYSVTWKVNMSVEWSSRWDYILESHTDIHWYSIKSSLVFVAILAGVVAVIMLKTLCKKDDAPESSSWKLLHGDVFRAPRKVMLLSVFVGTGTQLFFTCVFTLLIASIGLCPANRGALMTCVLVLYVCLGTPAGYTSSYLYQNFGGVKWKYCALLTALSVPGVVFGIFFLLNLVLWAKASSAAVPFTSILALLGLWFGIALPLTFIGAYVVFRKRPKEGPVQTNEIPRKIPRQSIFTRPLPGFIMGGVIPFVCMVIHLFFFLSSIWANQTYSMMDCLPLVFLILVVTCSEATIILCYFHLCGQDYRWWWRSFLTSGSSAIYCFIYCVHYFLTKLEMSGAINVLLYFGYTTIMMFLFFILTGSIGFFACFVFVSKMYGVVKIKDEVTCSVANDSGSENAVEDKDLLKEDWFKRISL